MRPEVEAALAVLKSKPLWTCRRTAAAATFHFGKRHRTHDAHGAPAEAGDYALQLQCPWRIARKDRILVASDDLYFPAGYSSDQAPPPNFDWDRQPNRRDKLLAELFAPGRPTLSVRKIEPGFAGSFRLLFDDKMLLEVVPVTSRRIEHWRLLRPKSDEPVFVLTGAGPEM
jgi:hypothetical protein